MKRLSAIAIVAALIALVVSLVRPGEEKPSETRGGSVAKNAPRGVRWSGGDSATSVGSNEKRAVEGRVVDALTGEPIDGAMISLRSSEGEELVASASDHDGRFSFKALAGAHAVAASAPGYAFLAQPIAEGALLLSLDRAVRLQGVVVDPNGAPVAGAEVWAEDAEGDDWERWPARPASDVTSSASDGSFVIEDAPSGLVVVHATHARFSPGETEVGGIGPGGTRGEVRVALVAPAMLRGIVLDSNGAPAQDVAVMAHLRYDDRRIEPARTGADGRFTIGPAPSGIEGWVTATRGSEHGVGFFLLSPGETDDVEIRLAPKASITGRVIDEDGSPVAGADVWVRRISKRAEFHRPDENYESAETDADGRFMFAGLETDGQYRLSVSAEGYRGNDAEADSGAGEVTITLSRGMSIFGTITTAAGARVKAAQVVARRVVRRGSERRGQPAKADGSWRLAGLSAGEWEVFAEAQGHARSAKVLVSVTDDSEEHGPITLTLGAAGRVRGRVVGPDGSPLPGARVSISRPGRTWMEGEERAQLDWRGAVRTDHQGRFVLDTGAGDLSLFVYHPEFHAEVARVTVSPDGEGDAGTIYLRAGEGASAIFEFSGIGAIITKDDGRTKVREILPGSPADRSGVRKDDVILAIDDFDTAEAPLGEIIERIRGPVGTTVTLTLAREGNSQPLEINVVRDKIRT